MTKNLVSMIKIQYCTSKLQQKSNSNYDSSLSWIANMRSSLVFTTCYILENRRKGFFSQSQMTEYKVGSQHNVLNTVTLQKNSLHLTRLWLCVCGGGGDLYPPPNLPKFLENGSFCSVVWTKLSWEYFRKK